MAADPVIECGVIRTGSQCLRPVALSECRFILGQLQQGVHNSTIPLADASAAWELGLEPNLA